MTDHNPLYADACENCPTYDVFPESALRDGAEGIIAGYSCPNCRHVWTCGWQIVPGRAIPPEPAPNSTVFNKHVSAQVSEQVAIARARKHLSKEDPS
ncbi:MULTISPECIES: hypothetical protein [unclassified Streptomyces]|uniref:hypothetical protein n=1 Tax=unclassified Streptomyces TaxID=2593676 RepID=UPI0033F13CEF